MINNDQYKSIENIIFNCGGLNANDHVLILCNGSTRQIADEFLKCALYVNQKVKLMEIPDLPNHGAEPVDFAKEAMCRSTLIHQWTRADSGSSLR